MLYFLEPNLHQNFINCYIYMYSFPSPMKISFDMKGTRVIGYGFYYTCMSFTGVLGRTTKNF